MSSKNETSQRLLDVDWSFEEAVGIISGRHFPGGSSSGPQRNSLIEAWAYLVGRERAVTELRQAISRHGSITAMGRALRIGLPTIRRFQRNFAAAPRSTGLLLFFDSRLGTIEKLLVQFAMALAAEGAEGCEWEVTAYGAGTLVRLYGLDDEALAEAADNLFASFTRGQRSLAHSEIRKELAELKGMVQQQTTLNRRNHDLTRAAINAEVSRLLDSSSSQIELRLSDEAIQRLNQQGAEHVKAQLREVGLTYSQKTGALIWKRGTKIAGSVGTTLATSGFLEVLRRLFG